MENKHTDLKRKAISGIIWKGLERIMAQLVSTVVAIILARILMPEDYSVVSIVTIFFAFCGIFITSGLNSALIQKKDSDVLDYSTALITHIIMAVIMYVIMFFLAPVLARLYDKPILVPVIRVMSLTFFINGYKSVISAKITADLRFRKFFWATIVGTIVSAVVGIVMAVKGYGPWALVAQQMTNSFIDALILTFVSNTRFVFRFSFERFRRLFKFGGKIMLSSLINETYNQTKPLIVGIRFSAVDLAYYNKGNTYPNLVVSVANDTLAASLFPTMSKVQNKKEVVLNMTRRFMKISSFLVFPMMIGFLVISENFVRIVLTEKWLPIVPYLMIFCIADMFKPIQTGNMQAIKAIGRSGVYLMLEIIQKASFILIILSFLLFADTPIILAASGILTSVLASIINAISNKRVIGYGYLSQIADLGINLLTASLMGVAVYFMKYIPLNFYLLTFIQIVAGAVIYLGINLAIRNENVKYLVSTVKEFFKKPSKSASDES